jgi:hypothetical protein
MAASTGGSSTAGIQGFPIITGRPPENSTGKDPEQTGEPKKKPCRACTDFKSWMKVQKTPQTPAAAPQVSMALDLRPSRVRTGVVTMGQDWNYYQLDITKLERKRDFKYIFFYFHGRETVNVIICS